MDKLGEINSRQLQLPPTSNELHCGLAELKIRDHLNDSERLKMEELIKFLEASIKCQVNIMSGIKKEIKLFQDLIKKYEHKQEEINKQIDYMDIKVQTTVVEIDYLMEDLKKLETSEIEADIYKNTTCTAFLKAVKIRKNPKSSKKQKISVNKKWNELERNKSRAETTLKEIQNHYQIKHKALEDAKDRLSSLLEKRSNLINSIKKDSYATQLYQQLKFARMRWAEAKKEVEKLDEELRNVLDVFNTPALYETNQKILNSIKEALNDV